MEVKVVVYDFPLARRVPGVWTSHPGAGGLVNVEHYEQWVTRGKCYKIIAIIIHQVSYNFEQTVMGEKVLLPVSGQP